MKNNKYPILEYDRCRRAIKQPLPLAGHKNLPGICVLCFFLDVIEKLAQEGRLVELGHLETEMGRCPVYEVCWGEHVVAVAHPGVGAPLAAIVLEELIASGTKKIIACGGAGVLQPNLDLGQIILPVAAVRDEGTSYHYLPPGRDVKASAEAVKAVEVVLTTHRIPFCKGKTWTTDAVYRETCGKLASRRQEGCLTVEMECAALYAVALFRGVDIGQILYGGDSVNETGWNSRNWKKVQVREKLFWLAVEAVVKLGDGNRDWGEFSEDSSPR